MSQIRSAPEHWTGILRQLGPGLIISAAIVGSGELIVTTKLGGDVGFRLLWFILFGCLIKVFVQVELGRFVITHGKTTLEAMDMIPGPRWKVSWLVWVWMVMFVATFFQLAGIVGGVAEVFRMGGAGWSNQVLAGIIVLVCAVLLVSGRYRLVEVTATIMVALFTLFTILAVGALYWTQYAIRPDQILSGLTMQMPESFTTAFAAFGIIGVGASELIYYPYWCLEKGYARYVGTNDESPEWRQRAAGWLRVLYWDAWISMIIYTGATVAFYLLGAAVLHGKGLRVTNDEMIPTLSELYKESFGSPGLWVFLAGAFVVLFSTVFIATASNARLFVDLFRLFHWIPWNALEAHRQLLVRISCVLLPCLYLIFFLIWKQPVTLVFVGALAQSLMLPFLSAAALWFHYRQSHPGLRPRTIWVVFLWISGISMTAVGFYQTLNLFAGN